MRSLTVTLALLAAVLFVLALFLKRRPLAPEVPREYKVHYVRRDAMTPTELKFFARLVAALPNSVVAPQVAMSALVDIAEHQKRGKYKVGVRRSHLDVSVQRYHLAAALQLPTTG